MHYIPGLYIVATPIGNLADITLRAIQTLQNSNYILCEDTRVAKKLLQKYDIRKKVILYNDYSDDIIRQRILELIDSGNVVSLISDAGTPLICDPGYKLIESLQQHKCHIDSAPGPCSVIASLCLSGLATDRFMFLGFLPKTANQITSVFEEVRSVKATLIFFEAPLRILASLKIASQILGNRQCAIVREITKLHQEVIKDTLPNMLEILSNKKQLKGEIVLLIAQGAKENILDEEIVQKLKLLKAQGFSSKDAAKIVATILDVKKTHAYDLLSYT